MEQLKHPFDEEWTTLNKNDLNTIQNEAAILVIRCINFNFKINCIELLAPCQPQQRLSPLHYQSFSDHRHVRHISNQIVSVHYLCKKIGRR